MSKATLNLPDQAPDQAPNAAFLIGANKTISGSPEPKEMSYAHYILTQE